LDDIFQFGYALRYSHHDYTLTQQYANLLNEYLAWCQRNNNSAGTIDVKRTKIRQFLCFLDGRKIELSELTAADISDFMTTLCRYHRATIHIFSSVLRDFFRYLQENGTLENDLSPSVQRPKIYIEENIPETWTPEEVRQLLSVIDRSNAIGKRDYAMLLLAILLGMRAGDICALKFKNLDWHQKLITYTQQKTKKTNTLPLLPIIGDAIIDYLKNGRLDSDCDNVFIRHIHPYGEFQSSTSLSENLKRYMKYAGLTVKKRKTAHSLRHTLASSLLYDGTPLMTISNILGHNSPKTTSVYTKVDLPALRKCALSYGKRRELV
jgi:integrase/recombinase XerD